MNIQKYKTHIEKVIKRVERDIEADEEDYGDDQLFVESIHTLTVLNLLEIFNEIRKLLKTND